MLVKHYNLKPNPKLWSQDLNIGPNQSKNNKTHRISDFNDSENLPSNIMFDKRVVRGNTYANSQTTGDKKLTTLKQFKKPP